MVEEGVLPLSFDYKPGNNAEAFRVEDDGGFVKWGRVDGDLAVSRGFGDFGPRGHRPREGATGDGPS